MHLDLKVRISRSEIVDFLQILKLCGGVTNCAHLRSSFPLVHFLVEYELFQACYCSHCECLLVLPTWNKRVWSIALTSLGLPHNLRRKKSDSFATIRGGNLSAPLGFEGTQIWIPESIKDGLISTKLFCITILLQIYWSNRNVLVKILNKTMLHWSKKTITQLL